MMTIGCVRIMSITASPLNWPRWLGTDHRVVTGFIELGASERNGSGSLLHGISPTGYRAGSRGIRMQHSVHTCPTDTLVLVDTFVQ